MKASKYKFAWLDGKIVPIEKANVSIMSHAIHYGTSIFEGLRAYGNSKNLHIFRLEDHIARFRNSGLIYSISLPFTNEQIQEAIINLCKKNKARSSCYIRPFYFIGEYGISLNVTNKAPVHVAVVILPVGRLFKEDGVKACISTWRRINDCSTPIASKAGGNYLNSIISTQEAARNGFDESIMLDYHGKVSEAPGENIFVVKDNTVFTPPMSSSALEGITRKSMLEILQDNGYSCKEKEITRTEIYHANEIFLTGTAAEITPVISIDNIAIGDEKPGEVTKKVFNIFNQITSGKNKRYSNWLTPVY